jgi:nucleotide-binding universal stress UspA family protein
MSTVVAGVSPVRPRPELVAWAAAEAWQRGATLELVTVGDTVPDVVVEDRPELAVVAKVVGGRAEQALSDAALGADLLVIGASSQSPFTEAITGSVPGALLTAAPCPVVVVPKDLQPVPDTAPIVVGVDAAETSRLALEYGFATAARAGRPLVALYCWAAPRARTERVAERAEHVRALTIALGGFAERYPDVPVTELLIDNDPVEELARRSYQAALLVLGSRGRGPLTSLAFGSVSRILIRSSHSPVAVLGPGLRATHIAG